MRIPEDPYKLTDREQKLYDLLKDGAPHSFEEIVSVMDPMYEKNNVRQVMSVLRTKLRVTDNRTVICEFKSYRLVAYVSPVTDD